MWLEVDMRTHLLTLHLLVLLPRKMFPYYFLFKSDPLPYSKISYGFQQFGSVGFLSSTLFAWKILADQINKSCLPWKIRTVQINRSFQGKEWYYLSAVRTDHEGRVQLGPLTVFTKVLLSSRPSPLPILTSLFFILVEEG